MQQDVETTEYWNVVYMWNVFSSDASDGGMPAWKVQESNSSLLLHRRLRCRSGFVYRVINNPLNIRSCSGFSLTSSDLVLTVQFTFFHLMLQSRFQSMFALTPRFLVTVNILHAQMLRLFISLITHHLFLNIEKDVTADFMLLGTGLNSHWLHHSAWNNPVLNHPFTSFVENMEGLQVPHEVVTCHLKNKHQVGHDVLAVWGKLQECFTFHCSLCTTS